MPELAYDQWIIIARDLINKEVTILRDPYMNQIGICIDIWADQANPRVINVEASDGTLLEKLQPNEYKKI